MQVPALTHRCISGPWRQLVRHLRVVAVSRPSALVVIGNGAPTVGKSAMLISHPNNFLINCPEPTSVLTTLLGIGHHIRNILYTRSHWDTVAGTGAFLSFVDQESKKKTKTLIGLKRFSYRRVIYPFTNFELFPYGEVFRNENICVQPFQLNTKASLPTIAYHILITRFGEEPHSLLILDSPSCEHITTFLKNTDLQTTIANSPPSLVLHFCEPFIQRSKPFQQLVHSLPRTCQHLMLDGVLPSALEAVWLRTNIIRHYFENPRIFPLSPLVRNRFSKAKEDEAWHDLSDADWEQLTSDLNEMRHWLLSSAVIPSHFRRYPIGVTTEPDSVLSPFDLQQAPAGLPRCWSARSMQTFQFCDKTWTDQLDVSLDTSRILASAMAKNFHCEIPVLKEKARQMGRKIKDDVASGVLPRVEKFPKVIFVGTGATYSLIDRNVSCIFLQIDANTSVMLDCGLGSIHRMRSFLGVEETEAVIRSLKLVCISHDHADHHLGLPSMLMEWQRLHTGNSKLSIMANDYVFKTLRSEANDLCKTLEMERFRLVRPQKDNMPVIEGLANLKVMAVPVVHKVFSYGFSLRHSDWHIVYSGDTAPCPALVDAGKACDLLIHEATHQDDQWLQAKTSNHSTTSEAIEVARKMEAKRLVLTHIGHQERHWPVALVKLPDHVVSAIDGMQLSLDDVFYFRGERTKNLSAFIQYSFDIDNYQYFSDLPNFVNPPRPVDNANEEKGSQEDTESVATCDL